MSTLAVDQNGDRITNDILTSGYLRQEIEDSYKISIPTEIKQVCFDFWFIKICDEWDIEICEHKGIQFSGPIVQLNLSSGRALYGRHSVSSGQYEWRLRVRSESTAGFAIGIIQDDKLENYVASITSLYGEGMGAFWATFNGMFYQTSGSLKLTQPYTDEIGNLMNLCVTMRFNVDDKTITYSVNDEDNDGVVDISSIFKNEKSYRLYVYCLDGSIELL